MGKFPAHATPLLYTCGHRRHDRSSIALDRVLPKVLLQSSAVSNGAGPLFEATVAYAGHTRVGRSGRCLDKRVVDEDLSGGWDSGFRFGGLGFGIWGSERGFERGGIGVLGFEGEVQGLTFGIWSEGWYGGVIRNLGFEGEVYRLCDSEEICFAMQDVKVNAPSGLVPTLGEFQEWSSHLSGVLGFRV